MDKLNRIKELIKQLNKYRDCYYNNSESIISDREYDDLFDELQELEKETGVILTNSPTQTVGYEVMSKLNKVTHSHPMLSLDKTKSIDDLKKFAYKKDCILMHKLDGLTVLLTYDNGDLTKAETRGDGLIGEDILHNAKVFENIPLTINCKEHFEIEGEAIITYDDFEKINATIKNEKDKYKNPRNLASGSVRQLDSSIAAKRHLKFIAWKVPSITNTGMTDALGYAGELGFDIVPFELVRYRDDFNTVIDILKNEATKLGYPIDGLVMAYDDIQYGLSLGATGHHPKHSIAFKFREDEETTILKDIEFSMGTFGVLTPVAIFEPVELCGTTVERASLHNISILTELDLHAGDEIVVYKANEIIPQIRENLSATKEGRYIQIPSICPVCGGVTEIKKDNDTMVLVCKNQNCKGKLLGKLKTFASKQGMDIIGLSEATLELLVDRKWITSFKDLYNIKESHIRLWKNHTVGFGDKSVQKILDSIEASRKTTLDKLLTALSIPLIGKSTAKDISQYCNGDVNTFTFIMENTSLEFAAINGVGVAATNSLDDWWQENREMFYELLEELEITVQEEKGKDNSQERRLDGMTFVVTGTVNHFKNRSELQEKIESLGGKVIGSVSAKTSVLINNDVNSNSSKNVKAKKLNIPIWDENKFLKYIS